MAPLSCKLGLAVLLTVAGGCALLAPPTSSVGHSEPGQEPEEPEKGDLVIGMSAAFTGPSRGLGIEFYRGAQTYFLEVNSTGGVHGRKLLLRAYDDGYNPDPAVANTVRLIEKDHAFVLFGYVGTPTVTRVLPLLSRYSRGPHPLEELLPPPLPLPDRKRGEARDATPARHGKASDGRNKDRDVLLFCPFTGAEPQRQPPYAEYVFNLRASYHEETGELVDNLVAVGRRRIAVFYQIDAYGRSGWFGVRAALERHRLKMTGEATYRRGAEFGESMKRQVELLRADNPDAVICIGSYAACAAFIRDARNAGWDVPLANVSFVGADKLLGLLQEHGRKTGKDYTPRLLNSQVVPLHTRTDLEAANSYRELVKRHNPALPPGADPRYSPLPASFVSFEGFLSARLLVKVLRQLPADDLRESRRGRLRQAAENCKDIDLGIDVHASFGPDRHQGLDKIYFTTVERDHHEPIRDWKRWEK